MISLALGILIGVIHLLGYWIYYRESHAEKDAIKPEPMSWMLWTFGSLVNLFSYSILSGDLVKDILPFVCSVACILIFIDQWKARGRRLEKVTKEGLSMLSLDVISLVVGCLTMSALVTNISCQVGTVATYVPIIMSTDKEPTREKPLPWILWSLAYGLDVILVIARWEQWGDVVYPATCFVLTVIVAVITTRKRTL